MDAVTAPPRWPVARYCSCGRLEQEHKDTGRRGTDNGACPGFVLDREEERPPEYELRRMLDEHGRRLAAVLALHEPSAEELPAHPDPVVRDRCSCGWWSPALRLADEPAQHCPTGRAARGET